MYNIKKMQNNIFLFYIKKMLAFRNLKSCQDNKINFFYNTNIKINLCSVFWIYLYQNNSYPIFQYISIKTYR